jgi:hypothetical protein
MLQQVSYWSRKLAAVFFGLTVASLTNMAEIAKHLVLLQLRVKS